MMEGRKQEDCCVTIPLLLGSRDVGTKASIGTARFIHKYLFQWSQCSLRNWNTLNSIRIGERRVVQLETTIYPKKNDRHVMSSNFRICGCKARVVFDMVPNTTKYTLSTFDVEHNHELDRVEYKHLSKAERKLSDAEQLLLSKMRMQTLVLLELIICKMAFVPSTAIDNHRRSVTVGSGLLKKETPKAYGWLLKAFRKAFVRARNIVVTSVAKKVYKAD
nr:protein FAR1-related sequence 5-like [Tanacetum cinerariifolium]